jgi:hypothetical protein
MISFDSRQKDRRAKKGLDDTKNRDDDENIDIFGHHHHQGATWQSSVQDEL